MRLRIGSIILMLALGLGAGVLVPGSEAQTVKVGALAGPLPEGATVGLRGPVTPEATVGAFRGPLPSGATTGALARPLPPDATVGALAGPLPSDATVGALSPGLPPGATAGAVSQPLPSDARFGAQTPQELANSLDRLAEIYVTDRQYANAERLLRRSLTVRERTLGPEHPDVARSLEKNAALLRRRNREAEAEDMEARARQIRAKP